MRQIGIRTLEELQVAFEYLRHLRWTEIACQNDPRHRVLVMNLVEYHFGPRFRDENSPVCFTSDFFNSVQKVIHRCKTMI